MNAVEKCLITILITVLSVHQFECNKDWDLLIFTQHWPITVCIQYEESKELSSLKAGEHVCAFPPEEDQWTIHGVWPTKLHTEGPGFCNFSLKFHPEMLDGIKPDLLRIWPNLEGDKSETSLWKHEWLKHGTCAVSLESLNTELKYFDAGLDFFKKFNMTEILHKNNINPSDTPQVHVEDIVNAVSKTIGKNPQVQCIVEKDSKEHYLFEVRVCLNKQLELVDCDGIKGRYKRSTTKDTNLITNCPTDQLIHYPSQIKRLQVQLGHLPAEEKVTFPTIYNYDMSNDLKWYQDFDLLYSMLKKIRFIQWLTL